jgi:ribosomal protein L37AE/L43A
MSDTPGMSSDPETDTDESAVPCPACDSTNTVQIAARGLQHHCRDCNNEFDPTAGPMDLDLR